MSLGFGFGGIVGMEGPCVEKAVNCICGRVRGGIV